MPGVARRIRPAAAGRRFTIRATALSDSRRGCTRWKRSSERNTAPSAMRADSSHVHRAHRARGWVGVCRPETPLMPAGRSWRPRTNAFAFATTAAKSVPALVPEAENLAARVEDPAGRHGSDGTLPGQKRHRGRTMTLPQPTRMIDRDTNQVSARAIVRHRARPAARAS